MTSKIMTDTVASVTEFKANPKRVAASANGAPVAVLNRNKPAFYCVPTETYNAMLDRLEDAELPQLARQREDEESVPVQLDEL